jgi:hypothetical protein
LSEELILKETLVDEDIRVLLGFPPRVSTTSLSAEEPKPTAEPAAEPAAEPTVEPIEGT